MNNHILGVRIDHITLDQAADQIETWITQKGSPRYVVTPNIEFVMLAQTDPEFRQILNKSDMSIPDSARFGWAIDQLESKNWLSRLSKWPLFLTSRFFSYPVTTGTDLMEELMKRSCEKPIRIGLFGGVKSVADRLAECLKRDCEKISLDFVKSDIVVGSDGNMVKSESIQIPELDILFVALGQGKQEKWIKRNLANYPVKVYIGVGGAFDYLSGSVPRAPKIVRDFGFEWLFRLILQPWRIKRFGALVQFIFKILFSKNH